MSANSDFVKQLREIQGKNSLKLGSLPRTADFVSAAQGTSVAGRIMMVFAAIFAILVALVLIHFFVTPILPESIVNTRVIPGMNDEKLFWSTAGVDAQDIPTPMIEDKDNPIVSTGTQITAMFDFIVDSPAQLTGRPRVLLYRSPGTTSEEVLKTGEYTTYLEKATGGNPEPVNRNWNGIITNIIPSYNFIAYIDKDTNDLLIGTMVYHEGNYIPSQLTRIYNVPIRKSHRVAIVLLDSIMEVYFNGKLHKTTRLMDPIAQITGNIHGPVKYLKDNFGRVMNLRLWKRVLTAKEIESYGSGSEFKQVNSFLPTSCKI
jgi:hypothetical protein